MNEVFLAIFLLAGFAVLGYTTWWLLYAVVLTVIFGTLAWMYDLTKAKGSG